MTVTEIIKKVPAQPPRERRQADSRLNNRRRRRESLLTFATNVPIRKPGYKKTLKIISIAA